MIYAYDVESYKNFFSAVFINVDDLDDQHTFVIFENTNDRDGLIEFITQSDLTLVGHNSLGFDDMLLRAIMLYPNIQPQNLKNLTDKIIKRDENFRLTDTYRELAYPKNRTWRSIDTMAVTRVNQQRLGLKYAAILLQHERVQDLPIKPDDLIQADQLDLMLDYNVNDVLITIKLYKHLDQVLQLRLDVGELFGVDIHTANDTEIAKKIFNTIYAEKTGIKFKDFKNLRSPREFIKVADCLPDNILFKTPALQAVYNQIANTTLFEQNNYRYKHHVTFDGTTYDFGVGGLHSRDKDKPGIFYTDDEFIIRDSDITSMYPFNMINNKFYPKHLDERFDDVYRDIVAERIKAKKLMKQGDKFAGIKQAGLKIAINSTFGLMGSKYYWLFDPKALVSVTISGQLYLLDLIEKLSLVGIPTISANTDGIVCKIPRHLEHLHGEICREWELRTNFLLEDDNYIKYVRRDVNNYLTIKGDKAKSSYSHYEVKTKGAFSPGVWNGKQWARPLSKGFRYPVVPLAMYEYLVSGIPLDETIREHNNIHDFMIAQRVDTNKFNVEYTYVKDQVLKTDYLQKINRYVVSNKGGSLMKVDGQRRLSMAAGVNVLVLNDVDDINAKNYDLNYAWYIAAAQKIIDKVEPPKKPSLF